MIIKLTILLVLFCSLTINSFGQSNIQCDSITVYNGAFDKFFQDKYNSVKADTVLAIRHCFTTNGCSDTYGLLCWKANGQFRFKKVQRKNGKTISTSKLSKELVQQLINFYDQKVFEKIGEIEEKIWVDDGQYTTILFKTTGKCWRFEYGYSNSKDIRVVWTNKLLYLMRK